MSKQMVWIGIDVGKDEVWASMAGKKARSFATTMKGMQGMYRWSQSCAGEGEVRLCMESTGVYGYRVAVLCRQLGVEVSVINPAQITAFSHAQLRRTKTDQVDAEVIRCFAESQRPAPWQPPRKAVSELYWLVSELDALSEIRRQLENREHSRQFVPDLPKEALVASGRVRQSITRQIDNLQKRIEELAASDTEMNQCVQLLCTIPGIKQATATRLIAYGKNHWETHTARQLTAHAGLAPRHRQSGSSIKGKSRLAKQGDKRLRHVLYMPTVCATVHNPYVRATYQRLVANGKPKMLALLAAMRKLIILIRAILRNNKPFTYPKPALT
jgi:transposase